MLKRSIALLICSILVFPTAGYSWGNKGHQTVGRIAQLFLQDDNAQTTLDKIQAILKPGESLASIATWADTVKRVHFGPDVVVSDKDTQAFRRDLRNKNNRVWHFDYLPLDCPSYDRLDTALRAVNRRVLAMSSPIMSTCRQLTSGFHTSVLFLSFPRAGRAADRFGYSGSNRVA